MGVGTRWYVTERMSVRLEGLFHLWRVATPSAFLGTGSTEVSPKRWERSRGFSAGLHLGF
jgi:hypothetical protein